MVLASPDKRDAVADPQDVSRSEPIRRCSVSKLPAEVVTPALDRTGRGDGTRMGGHINQPWVFLIGRVVGSTAVVTTSLSVGYVIWILRGGSVLTAFMSAMPAWQSFDPLPILQSFERQNEDEDDSLLSIATQQSKNRDRKK